MDRLNKKFIGLPNRWILSESDLATSIFSKTLSVDTREFKDRQENWVIHIDMRGSCEKTRLVLNQHLHLDKVPIVHLTERR